MRPTSCEIDLDAVAHNVRALRDLVSPTPVCAVVKANGYGHGAAEVAKAALVAGAEWLAVALVEEGVELRAAGIVSPILVLSEPDAASMALVVQHDLTATVYSRLGIEALADAASAKDRTVDIHLGIDSGMRRVGAEVTDLSALASLISQRPTLELRSVWTHCPVADEPDNPFTDIQLDTFDGSVDVQANGVPTHVANSAAAMVRPERDALMVRCGIALYGIAPVDELDGVADLRPAMTLRSKVSYVKTVPAGQGVGYGHRFVTSERTTIATVPIGYADGVRRDLGLRGGEVLIGGFRHRVVGVVTMDQLMVDVGQHNIAVGDDVVLIGSQGDEAITAADVARTLDTIPYEVVCAVSVRVPRTYRGLLG